jgi:hypothetical protein
MDPSSVPKYCWAVHDGEWRKKRKNKHVEDEGRQDRGVVVVIVVVVADDDIGSGVGRIGNEGYDDGDGDGCDSNGGDLMAVFAGMYVSLYVPHRSTLLQYLTCCEQHFSFF